ncbi:MAG: hypothetical protein ABSH02_06880 [Candidatus Sulfotelmatobacter sp.]|jgi:hypothetical protein
MERYAQLLRKPSILSASIHQKLNLYALAAGATGVAMLAGAPSAEAEVVFTPAHYVITTNRKITLDLNHDGIGDFIISNHAFCTTDICGRTLRALPAEAGNRVEGMKSIFILKFASALQRGAQIGPSAVFSGKLMAVSGTEYGSGGHWQNVADRYLGLKFSISGSIHYGWARFSVTSGNETITATLTGYAYETVANRPITAGKTKGPAEVGAPAELGPATLGLLAMGSSGLALWRRD